MAQTAVQPPQAELVIPTNLADLLDLHASLTLSLWPALTLAISIYTPNSPSQPPTGKEIREWLSGAIPSMISEGQIRDQDDLEDVLVQVMGDEFECVIDDGSEIEVARRIWKAFERLKTGEDAQVEKVKDDVKIMWDTWMKRGGDKVTAASLGKRIEVAEDAQDTSDEDEDDDNEDEEMGEAPQLVEARPKKEKAEPEVDEEGFTKVVRGKKR